MASNDRRQYSFSLATYLSQIITKSFRWTNYTFLTFNFNTYLSWPTGCISFVLSVFNILIHLTTMLPVMSQKMILMFPCMLTHMTIMLRVGSH